MIKKILIGIFILGMVALAAIPLYMYQVHKLRVGVAEKPWSTNSSSNPGAPITIVDFVDYSCPYCYEFHPILGKATENDPSFNIVVHPVGLLGDNSKTIGAIILAAGIQKQDGNLHNAIMKLPHPIKPEHVFKAAESLPGINMAKLRTDAESDEMRILLRKNNAIFYALGFKGVPTILINGRTYSPTGDMPSPEALKAILKQ